MKREADAEEPEDEHSSDHESPVQCWDDAIDVTPSLIADARILWKYYGGDRTKAKSVWVDANATPRCHVEHLALSMADFHLKGHEYEGVEVWTQVRKSGGLGFHFDKDEQAANQSTVWKHPIVGTATYLSDEGAPLVVFTTASEEGLDSLEEEEANEEHQPPSKKVKRNENNPADRTNEDDEDDDAGPSHAWICYPQKGRHVAFAGNLLHGVPEELQWGEQSNDRISLLVNIWLDHKPQEVNPLPSEIVEQMNQDIISNSFNLVEDDEDDDDDEQEEGERKDSNVESAIPLKPTEITPTESDTLCQLKEHIPGDTAPLPMDAIKRLVNKKDSPFIQISY